MSISSIKKILLAGTALVAVATFSAQANAAVVAVTSGLPGTWASAGTHTQDATLSQAAASDTIAQGVGSTFLLTITNNGVANDGSGLNTFGLGAIAGTTGGFTSVNGSANDLAVTIASAAYNAAAPITVSNTGFVANGNTTTITGALSTVGGTTTITNGSTAAAKTVTLAVGGAASLGAVNITAGTFAGADASLTLANATNTLGVVTLTEAGSGSAKLTISSTGAQTITSIDGNAAGKGTLSLTGNGSSISGAVGAIHSLAAVNAGANGNTNTFTGAVNATAFNVTGTGTAVLNAAALNTITTTNFAGDGTLTLATGGTLTGNITTTTTNTGTLTLSGTETITGSVGSTTGPLWLKAVNIGAGAAGITGDVAATTITLTGSNAVSFGGNVTGTTLAFAGTTATATIASGKNLTAAVTGAAASTLTFAGGTQASTGVINNNALILNGGANSGATTFNSAVTAATINVTGTGSERFRGNTAGNLVFAAAAGSATVDAGISFTGSLNGTGGVAATGIGDVTFSGASSGITTIGNTGHLRTLTLAGTGTTVSTTGAVNAATTTALGSNILSTGGAFNLVAGQTLTAAASGVSTTGHVDAGANAANVAAASVVKLTNVTAAGDYDVVTGTGGTIVAASAGNLYVNGVANTAVGTTAFTVGRMTYTEQVSATALRIHAVQAAISSALGSAITSNDTSVGAALTTIGLGGQAELDTFQGSLNAANSATAVHNLLQSVTPTVDGGSEQAALDVGAEVSGVTDTRIAALRSGDATSGVAAGASANGSTMWLQGYGQYANQDTRDGVAGYDSNTWGGVIGADSTALMDRAIVGIAFNYGHSNIDSNNVNTTATDIDNYGVSLYGNYDLGDKMFVDGQLGYAYNAIDSARHDVGGVVGQTASSSTNSDQFSAKAAVGRDYAMDGDMTLTPDVSAAYTYLNTDGYTETGAGGLNQTVGSHDTNVLNLGVGATASWKIKDADDNLFKPALHVGYAYDAIGDAVETSSSFQGVPGTVFTTTGPAPARSTFDIGAKLIYATRANWDVSASYDFKVKEDYTSHTGAIRATAHF